MDGITETNGSVGTCLYSRLSGQVTFGSIVDISPKHVSRMVDAWKRALAIHTKPLARQRMSLWRLDRLFDA